jgi:hypothetical protein
MLDLDADKIKTYQTCSLLYKYRHVDGIYEPILGQSLIRERFENVLKRVLTFYFYQKQEGNQPSIKSLLNRFQKLWFGEGYTAEDLFSEPSSAIGKKDKIQLAADTIGYFNQFYEDFDESHAIPLLIREDFSIPLTRELKLSGIFDLVLKEGDTYNVIKWRANNGKPLKTADFFIDFTILDRAFRYRMEGRDYKVNYFVYDFTSVDKGFNRVEVELGDQYTLLYWCNEILNEVTYPPRRGLTTHCRGCHFDKPCSEYVITEDMLKKV